jgi:hypothetical protein
MTDPPFLRETTSDAPQTLGAIKEDELSLEVRKFIRPTLRPWNTNQWRVLSLEASSFFFSSPEELRLALWYLRI